jgi:hypothetical protein
VLFDVLRTSRHLWVDYRNWDGTVVTSWKLY